MSFYKEHKESIARKAVEHLSNKIEKLVKKKGELENKVVKASLEEFNRKTRHLPEHWFSVCENGYMNKQFNDSQGHSLSCRVPRGTRYPESWGGMSTPYSAQDEKTRSLVAELLKVHIDEEKLKREKTTLYNQVLNKILPYRSLDSLRKDWPKLHDIVGDVVLNGRAIVKSADFSEIENKIIESKNCVSANDK